MDVKSENYDLVRLAEGVDFLSERNIENCDFIIEKIFYGIDNLGIILDETERSAISDISNVFDNYKGRIIRHKIAKKKNTSINKSKIDAISYEIIVQLYNRVHKVELGEPGISPGWDVLKDNKEKIAEAKSIAEKFNRDPEYAVVLRKAFLEAGLILTSPENYGVRYSARENTARLDFKSASPAVHLEDSLTSHRIVSEHVVDLSSNFDQASTATPSGSLPQNLADFTPAQMQIWRQVTAAMSRAHRAQLTPEQAEKESRQGAERSRASRARMSPEKRAERSQKEAERLRIKRALAKEPHP